MDKINQDKIEERDEATQQHHRDDNYHGRVTQFLVTAEPFFLRVPRPRTFRQFDFYFTEEVFDFGNHQLLSKTSNIQRSTSNAQFSFFAFEFQCSTLGVGRLQPLCPRQEGLEPPTDGFGDRYSTN